LSRPLSPSIALACSELLEVVSRNAVTPAGATGLALGAVPSVDVLDAAMAFRWIEVAPEGALKATARGARALAESDGRRRLRLLLIDYVEAMSPSWLYLTPSGRRETLLQAPPGIRQVIVESGLAYDDDEDAVAFWDGLAARARGSRDASLAEIGRRGERLTVEHERTRTGVLPKWIALDSSSDGYDVLSMVSASDQRRLTVEVKASERPLSLAYFHLTRNEWEMANESLNHVFHLWSLVGPRPMLATLSINHVLAHVPADSGDGCWKSVSIPFEAFAGEFSTIA